MTGVKRRWGTQRQSYFEVISGVFDRADPK